MIRKAWKVASVGILVALFALPRGSLLAQEVERGPRMSIGPRLGVTLPTLRFEDPNANEQTKVRGGFHVGAEVSVPVGSYLETGALLLYSQGGFGGQGGHPVSLRTGHVELPVLVRARLPWDLSPHLTVGIAPRLRVHCSLEDVGLVGEAGCDDPVAGTEWRRFDLASLFGLGVSFRLGKGTLGLEALVHWGLLDVKSDPLPPGWAKSADIRISPAYRLSLGESR